MQYQKKEEYAFKFPQEYNAYLDFKHKLRDMGIHFQEEGGSSYQRIIIRTNGFFEIREGEVFLS